jgi:hypothetical protein
MHSHGQSTTAVPKMKQTPRGIYIDFNDQYAKQVFSIRVSRDQLSDVIDSNFEPAKQDSAKVLAFRGMQINFNEQSFNHDSSIRLRCISFSNVIDPIPSGFQSSLTKHVLARTSTLRGKQICFNQHP